MVEVLSPSGESVSSQDGTAPPVLFVVGTAGAGKSSLVTAFQRWGRFLEVDILAINLDPGAEKVDYDTEFDVRDLVSLSDVMVEYELGPNGAQILAADLVASRADEVFDEIEGLSCDILIVDTPGQVELFAFREASNHLVNVIGQGRACLIFLFDPMLSQTPSGFVSQMLLSAIVHFRLGLPTANFLSKSDLLEPEALERVMDWGDNLDILEAALFEESAQQALDTESGSQRAEFAIGQLRMMQLVIENVSPVPLLEVEVNRTFPDSFTIPDGPEYNVDESSISWDIGRLNVGESRALSLSPKSALMGAARSSLAGEGSGA